MYEYDGAVLIAEEILENLPNEFDIAMVEEKYPTAHMNSLNIVLRQEMMQFNRLLGCIRISLNQILEATKGMQMTPIQSVLSTDSSSVFRLLSSLYFLPFQLRSIYIFHFIPIFLTCKFRIYRLSECFINYQ